MVREFGGYCPGPAAGDHLTLRVTERARLVVHEAGRAVPRLRRPDRPTGELEDASVRSLQDQLDRLTIAGRAKRGRQPGFRRIARSLDPGVRVSIVVPTLGRAAECPGGAGPSSSRPSAAR